MPKEMDWKQRSKELDTLDIEIGFLISDSFYTGDPNNISQIQNKEYEDKNKLPGFKREAESIARTSEVMGHEEELTLFYRQIVEKAASHGKDFNSIRSYFWIRLWLRDKNEESTISFPWYDSLNEMQRFFFALESYNDPDKVYWDADQGWEIHVAADDIFFYFRQLDPDEGEEHENIKLPKDGLITAVYELNQRATSIIAALTKGVGVDVWSEHIKEARFGTHEWQPGDLINQKKRSFFSRLLRR
ncbi:hypothetical protein A6D6_00261 [Alcanivorax xiamenensis]|uniref:Uncharacterized protein n=1 Tax=Alcanivorax xiamenensis TaxID=1177156 RepID=A0ABQ6YED7_9GAMM|nr:MULTISPECIES: hypothetical protein [Alcanivorax]KAF0808552.1 hypothetical protein A6D6_00261 [Alcanivorax xiamenensis]